MVENFFVLTRKAEKQELLNYLKKNAGGEIDFLLARYSFTHGHKVALLRTYLNELLLAELIKVENNTIKLNEDSPVI